MRKLLKKIDKTFDIAQKGFGRPKSVSTNENIELVEKLILSQENQPGTHSTPAKIAHELNINCRSVSRIIDQDLDIRPMRKTKVEKPTNSNIEEPTISSRKLLSMYTQKKLQTAFFSGEKIFKLKQLYNSHNDVLNVLKEMRGKKEMSKKMFFCKIEVFLKRIMVKLVKAGESSLFLLNRIQK